MSDLLWADEVAGLKARIEALAAEKAELRARAERAEAAEFAAASFRQALAAAQAEVERLREALRYLSSTGMSRNAIQGYALTALKPAAQTGAKK